MRPSSKAYNFINNHIEILDESVEDFLQLTYMEKIQNRYVQEIVAMLNDANIETNEYQWKLFIDKFNYEESKFPKSEFEISLESVINGMVNWFGLSYSDIKFWILDDPVYSMEWQEDNNGVIIRI